MHGYVRATKDIDILICHNDLAEARNALRPIGYDLDAGIFKFDQGTDTETQLFRVSRADGFLRDQVVRLGSSREPILATRRPSPSGVQRLQVTCHS